MKLRPSVVREVTQFRNIAASVNEDGIHHDCAVIHTLVVICSVYICITLALSPLSSILRT